MAGTDGGRRPGHHRRPGAAHQFPRPPPNSQRYQPRTPGYRPPPCAASGVRARCRTRRGAPAAAHCCQPWRARRGTECGWAGVEVVGLVRDALAGLISEGDGVSAGSRCRKTMAGTARRRRTLAGLAAQAVTPQSARGRAGRRGRAPETPPHPHTAGALPPVPPLALRCGNGAQEKGRDAATKVARRVFRRKQEHRGLRQRVAAADGMAEWVGLAAARWHAIAAPPTRPTHPTHHPSPASVCTRPCGSWWKIRWTRPSQSTPCLRSTSRCATEGAAGWVRHGIAPPRMR